jgi:hypothetical protein
MARTAVVAGTATAVSNRVSRRQANRWEQQAAAEAPPQQAPPPQPPPQQTQYFAPPPQAPPSGGGANGGDLTADLTRLAEMKSQGLLTDEEFAAAKARLLGQ